jgi:hypothetical protein
MELSTFRLTIDIPEQHEVTYLTFFFLYLFLELFDSIAICKAN